MTAQVEVLEDGNFSFHWTNEFDIRDAVAEIATLTGWSADIEHIVHGWGRPDIYLAAGAIRIAVEVKVDLSTRAKCRKGIQQAASYRRALPELTAVILTAPTVDLDAMAEYTSSYPEVWVLSAAELVNFLRYDDYTLADRTSAAQQKVDATQARLDVMRKALAGISTEVPA